MRIAAVVVTYNRKDLLGECLDSLLRQSHPLDAIYIVDNHSTDGTCEYLQEKKLISPVEPVAGQPSETMAAVPLPAFPDRRVEVHYLRLPENTGSAGGFHEGMKRAVAAGFDWLWLMDDDLLTAPEALGVLVQQKQALEARGREPFLLNSLVLARRGKGGKPSPPLDGDALAFPLQELTAAGLPKRGVYHWRLSEVREQVREGLYNWACPFNGTFIPARLTAEVGLPNKDFFNWGEEKDFLWRVARRFPLYTAVDSKVYHRSSRDRGFDCKQYYCVRNMLIVNRHFRFTALRNFRLIVLSLARGLRHGRWGLRLVVRAIRDGLAGRLGKRDDLLP